MSEHTAFAAVRSNSSLRAPGAAVPADWWRLYDDPELDKLVEQAFAANTARLAIVGASASGMPRRRSQEPVHGM